MDHFIDASKTEKWAGLEEKNRDRLEGYCTFEMERVCEFWDYYKKLEIGIWTRKG